MQWQRRVRLRGSRRSQWQKRGMLQWSSNRGPCALWPIDPRMGGLGVQVEPARSVRVSAEANCHGRDQVGVSNRHLFRRRSSLRSRGAQFLQLQQSELAPAPEPAWCESEQQSDNQRSAPSAGQRANGARGCRQRRQSRLRLLRTHPERTPSPAGHERIVDSMELRRGRRSTEVQTPRRRRRLPPMTPATRYPIKPAVITIGPGVIIATATASTN